MIMGSMQLSWKKLRLRQNGQHSTDKFLLSWWCHPMETFFHVTGPLCGEFTGHRWIPLTKASNAELWCFLWSVPWINGWVNNPEAGDLRRRCAHYDITLMMKIVVFRFQFHSIQKTWFRLLLGTDQATSHQLLQCWQISHVVTRGQLV